MVFGVPVFGGDFECEGEREEGVDCRNYVATGWDSEGAVLGWEGCQTI